LRIIHSRPVRSSRGRVVDNWLMVHSVQIVLPLPKQRSEVSHPGRLAEEHRDVRTRQLGPADDTGLLPPGANADEVDVWGTGGSHALGTTDSMTARARSWKQTGRQVVGDDLVAFIGAGPVCLAAGQRLLDDEDVFDVLGDCTHVTDEHDQASAGGLPS